MVVEPGTAIESIEADNQWGQSVRVDFDRPTVVYFYPEDDTPGCTTEARQFNAIYERYERAGVEVYGVSTDDVDTHCEFAERHDLQFDLLADETGEIAETFGVPVEGGRVDRTTFVIVAGTVVGVYEGVRPDGHAKQVLRDVAGVGMARA